MMQHHWRPLAHERNSIFKCKQHTCTLHDPWGPEKYDYTERQLNDVVVFYHFHHTKDRYIPTDCSGIECLPHLCCGRSCGSMEDWARTSGDRTHWPCRLPCLPLDLSASPLTTFINNHFLEHKFMMRVKKIVFQLLNVFFHADIRMIFMFLK